VLDDVTLFHRYPNGPILTPADWPYPVNTVFNPAATRYQGETLLLVRVEDRRGISHLTAARSPDGRTGWRIDPKPLVVPDPDDPTTCWGVEDPRVTRIDELDAWGIAYTAYGPAGPAVALAVTTDFREIEPYGVVLPPEDKNASLLPRRIDGEFVLFHRPVSAMSGQADVWLSRSADLRSWSAPEPVMRARPGPWWDAVRIGFGPPPIETDRGWVVIYHGVKLSANSSIYRAGLALLDTDRPARVLRRGPTWVLGPSTDYELAGDVPNVVFPTGMVHDPETDDLRVYYGAADTCVGLATAKLAEVVDYLWSLPPEPDNRAQ